MNKVEILKKIDMLTVMYGGYWISLLDYGFIKELYARVKFDVNISRIRSNMLVTKDGDIIDDRQCVLDNDILQKELLQRGEIIGI